MEPEAYEELNRLEATHWWYEGMRRITHQLLSEVLDGRSGLNILDAGCGAGGNLHALSPFGQVLGFDYSLLALSYAKTQHPGKLARASIDALPYPDNAFDLVTSFDVIVCAEVRDDQTALNELARVTRPGGVVLVRVAALPALRGPHDTVVHGVRRYTAVELQRKLERAGLKPHRLTYANSLLLPLILVTRKIQNLLVRLGASPSSDVNQTPSPINKLLTSLLTLEASWIKGGRNFPAGVSLFGVAVKPIPSENEEHV